MPLLRRDDPVVLASVLSVLSHRSSPHPELGVPLLDILREMGRQPMDVVVDGWGEIRVAPKSVARLVVRCKGLSPEQRIPAARMADVAVRTEWVRLVRSPISAQAADYLAELLVGRATGPREAAMAELSKLELSEQQLDVLTDALSSKASEVRRCVMEVLRSQPEPMRERVAERLSRGDEHQRAAAVELIETVGAIAGHSEPTRHDPMGIATHDDSVATSEHDDAVAAAAAATERTQLAEPAMRVLATTGHPDRTYLPVVEAAEPPLVPDGWPHDGTGWLPGLLDRIDRDLTALDELELRQQRGDRSIEVKVGLDPLAQSWREPTEDELRVIDAVHSHLDEAADEFREGGRIDAFVSGLAGYCSLPMRHGFALPYRIDGGDGQGQWLDRYRAKCHPELSALSEFAHPRLLRSMVGSYFGALEGPDVDLARARGLCTVVATFAADDSELAGRLRRERSLGWLLGGIPYAQLRVRTAGRGVRGREAADLALSAHRWIDRPVVGGERSTIDDHVILDAVHHDLLSAVDVVDWAGSQTVRYTSGRLLATITSRAHERPDDLPPVLGEAADLIRDAVVASECNRGDLPTGWTRLVPLLSAVEGVSVLVDLLDALGDRPLWRSAREEDHREATLSRLIQISYPLPSDDRRTLSDAVRGAGIERGRLLELAMFAPQWAGLVELAVRQRGLEDAVWWWHAHNKDDKWHVPGELREVWSEGIARWAVVAPWRITAGGVDGDWFRRARRRVGADAWSQLEGLSKLTSPASGHRRAVNSSTALLAEDPEAYVSAIEAKRDREAIRCLGLVRLPRARRARLDELLRRRAVLLNVQPTQRKPASEKSQAENEAVGHALDSLAWSAGLVDVSRLNWMLEAEEARSLTDGSLSVTHESTTVSLEVDLEGNVVIVVEKAGKPLKSVPAKMRKLPEVAEIRARHRELKDMTKRVRSSLERSMAAGEMFGRSDLEEILEHPVLEPVAALLVLVDASGTTGVRAAGGTYLMVDGAAWRPKWPVRVAHPVDLLAAGEWPQWQRRVVELSMRQPFKQVFRELYVPTVDEVAETSGAWCRRYSGHRVSTAQARALLRGREWSVDRRGGATRSFAGVSWSASLDLRDELFGFGERSEVGEVSWWGPDHVGARLDDVPPVVFSETMRDLDLVVSVAHSSGSTPEASGASVQMRQALVREVARLFTIEASFDRAWVEVVGSFDTYRVHLGSGTVMSSAGAAIHLDVDVRAGRGRVFLPFLDDDPITAEIVTKVVTLGRDEEIRDAGLRSKLAESP